ncbi:MAG: TlpA family protein disulfide reductase [Candidatus Magasanikbacteria bacterium]|nr:TlpA family protein disulfide reductase [Candidatus Magasanikbacteria bacterium]
MKNKGWLIIVAVVAGFGLIRYLAHPRVSNSNGYTRSVSTTNSAYTASHASGYQAALNSSGAPNFSLPLLSGGTVSLADFRGKQPVILDFWTSWCPNCQRDMPKISELSKQYKDQVAVIGINLRENPATVANFVNSYGIVFPIALDSGRVGQLYGIQFTNTHILIDKQGNIVHTIPGDITEQDFELLARQ